MTIEQIFPVKVDIYLLRKILQTLRDDVHCFMLSFFQVLDVEKPLKLYIVKLKVLQHITDAALARKKKKAILETKVVE